MTTATNNLSAAVQQLIDARLDNIERVLMASGTSRLERQEIIASVEDQIMELIARKGDGELERDQMLQILASLDPPEAYLPENAGAVPSLLDKQYRSSYERAERGAELVRPIAAKYNKLSIICLVLAIVAILWVPAIFVLDILALIVSVASGLAAFVCGLVVMVGGREPVARRWMAIVGVISLPLALAMIFTLVLVNILPA